MVNLNRNVLNVHTPTPSSCWDGCLKNMSTRGSQSQLLPSNPIPSKLCLAVLSYSSVPMSHSMFITNLHLLSSKHYYYSLSFSSLPLTVCFTASHCPPWFSRGTPAFGLYLLIFPMLKSTHNRITCPYPYACPAWTINEPSIKNQRVCWMTSQNKSLWQNLWAQV